MIDLKNNRIMVFGDSVLKGVMYINDGARGKYKLYSGTLEERMADRGIELTRCCHMGATIDAGLERMRRMLAKGTSFADTTVMFEFGGNDCAYNWQEVSASPEAHHEPKNNIHRFISLYKEAIELARSAGANVMISSLVPIDAAKYMDHITRGLSYENILGWLGDINMLYRWHEGYNRAIEQLADECRIPLFDLRGEFLYTHAFNGLIGDDGIHPTAEGHKMIEDILVSSLSAAGAA